MGQIEGLPRRQSDFRAALDRLRTKLDHMARRERERWFVSRRVGTIVPNRQVADTGHFETRNRLRVARYIFCGLHRKGMNESVSVEWSFHAPCHRSSGPERRSCRS